VVPVNISRLEPLMIQTIENKPLRDQAELRTSHNHPACMTCHFFRHQGG
jgi:hypothetical protein